MPDAPPREADLPWAELRELGWHAVGWWARAGLRAELAREVPRGHLLHRRKVRAVARRFDRDDVLFVLQDGPPWFALVRLTWSRERDPLWPATTTFPDVASWLAAERAEAGMMAGPTAEVQPRGPEATWTD